MLITGIFKYRSFIQGNRLLQKINLVRDCNCVLRLLPKQIKLLQISHDPEIMIYLITVGSRLDQLVRRNQRKSFSEGSNVPTDICTERFPLVLAFGPQCFDNLQRRMSRFPVKHEIGSNTATLRRVEVSLMQHTSRGIERHTAEEVNDDILIALNFIKRKRHLSAINGLLLSHCPMEYISQDAHHTGPFDISCGIPDCKKADRIRAKRNTDDRFHFQTLVDLIFLRVFFLDSFYVSNVDWRTIV